MKATVRSLRHHKTFAASVVFTLAGCLLINVVALSVMYSVLWKQLPFREPERLVVLSKNYTKGNVVHAPCSLVQYIDFGTQIDGLESAAMYKRYSAIFGNSPAPLMIDVARTTPTLLDVLGVKPVIGTFVAREQCRPGADRVLVLTHEFWASQFAGDPNVVGRTVYIDSEPYVVIGVAPRALEQLLPHVKALKPYPWLDSQVAGEMARLSQSPYLTGQIVARMKRGVSIAQLNSRLALRERQVYEAAGVTYRVAFDQSGVSVTASALSAERGREVRPKLVLLECAALLVLVIGCANIANLLTARANVRTSEFAVRAALGAGKADVMLLVVAEAFVYMAAGSVLAVVATLGIFKVGGDLIVDLLKLQSPLTIEWWILVLGCVAAGMIGVGVGLLAGLRISDGNLAAAFQDGGRTTSAGRRIAGLNSLLVVAQVAFASLLLSSAALVLYGFVELVNRDPGFQTRDVVKIRYSQPPSTIKPTFHEDVMRIIRESAGIDEVAVGSHTPITKDANFVVNPIVVDALAPEIEWKRSFAVRVGISRDFFRTLSIPIIAGKNFNEEESMGGRNCVIVDRKFWQSHFGDSDPIGKRFSFWSNPTKADHWLTIVGVVGDIRSMTAEEGEGAPLVYLPFRDWMYVSNSVFVKSRLPVSEVLTIVRSAVEKVDPRVAVYRADTMDNVVEDDAAGRRTLVLLVCGFGLGALVLAVSGVYSVQAFNINSRAKEIAVRNALGADRKRLVMAAARQSFAQVVSGLMAGAFGAAVVFRMADGVLVTKDGMAFVFVALVALAVGVMGVASAIFACWRVVSLNPVEVLRRP